MAMEGGYPAEADIDTYISDRGLELLTKDNPNFIQDFKQFVYGILNAIDWASVLGVYCPSSTTFNVRGGKYLFAGQVKTYTAGSAVDPTDNDTTYVWMAADNTIGSDIDGNGWPTTEHIKLAEIDVDSDGVITATRDLRGQTFLQYLANYLTSTGVSVEALPIHWDKSSPADDDEIRLPFYGQNDNSEKIEYARLVIKLADVGDGSEDAAISLMAMIAGVLTSLGDIVGTDATQTLANKTLTSPILDTDVGGTAVLDEDNMTSNSPTKLATQQAIKEFVESHIVCKNNQVVCKDNQLLTK